MLRHPRAIGERYRYRTKPWQFNARLEIGLHASALTNFSCPILKNIERLHWGGGRSDKGTKLDSLRAGSAKLVVFLMRSGTNRTRS